MCRRWQSHMCGRCESVRGESGVIDTWASASSDSPPATYPLDAGAGVERLDCLAPSAPGHPAQAVREARWVLGQRGRVRGKGLKGVFGRTLDLVTLPGHSSSGLPLAPLALSVDFGPIPCLASPLLCYQGPLASSWVSSLYPYPYLSPLSRSLFVSSCDLWLLSLLLYQGPLLSSWVSTLPQPPRLLS